MAPVGRRVGFAFVGLFVITALAQGADDVAEKELQDLQKRVETLNGDPAKVREDLIKYRRWNPGTPYTVRAAELLSRLPSPLDKLDPANIPELERFDWHPKELVAVLGEARGRQAGQVNAIAYSPDGKLLVSGGNNGLVRIWDPATLRQKHLLGISYGVTCLLFSKDGKTLLAGNSQGYIHSWDVTGDKPKPGFTVRPATAAATGMSLSPGGKFLAVSGADTLVHLLDLSEMVPKEKISCNGHTAAANGVAHSPDGRMLVTVGADKSIRLWDPAGTKNDTVAAIEDAHKASIGCLAFLPPDGRTLATGAADGSIKFWDMSGSKPKEKSEVATKAGAVNALTYTVTGKTLATAHADGTIHFWDASTSPPKEKFVLEGHPTSVVSLAFSPNGRDLASGSQDWTLRTWNLSAMPKPKQYAEPKGHLSYVYASAFSPDDTTLSTGSYDRMVRMWNVAEAKPKEKATLAGDPWPIYTLAYSPDGKMLASGGQGTTIRLWNAVKMDALRQIKPTPGQVKSLAFTPDGKALLSATGNTVVVWDPATTEQVRILEGHEGDVHCVAVSPDGKRALTGSGSLTYKENGQPVIENGKYVYKDPTLRIYDIDSGMALHKITAYTIPVNGAAYSSDGKTALSTAGETKVWTHDISANEPKEKDPLISGPGGPIRQPVCSADGKKIATLGPDASVVIWDAATGKVLTRFTLPENVGHVSFANDSRHLAVTAATGVMYILRLNGPEK